MSTLRDALAELVRCYTTGVPFTEQSEAWAAARAALAQSDAQPAVCAWTHCPNRVGDQCCNECPGPAASQQEAQPCDAGPYGPCPRPDACTCPPVPPRGAAQPTRELSYAEIDAGWKGTFSTNNPFCPCNLQSFTKAVRWAERAVRGEGAV
jgi:hypothetical protein